MTEMEAQAYAVIKQVYQETGFTPSSRQLAKMLDRKNTWTYELMRKLEQKGHIVYHEDRKRGYILKRWQEIIIGYTWKANYESNVNGTSRK